MKGPSLLRKYPKTSRPTSMSSSKELNLGCKVNQTWTLPDLSLTASPLPYPVLSPLWGLKSPLESPSKSLSRLLGPQQSLSSLLANYQLSLSSLSQVSCSQPSHSLHAQNTSSCFYHDGIFFPTITVSRLFPVTRTTTSLLQCLLLVLTLYCPGWEYLYI